MRTRLAAILFTGVITTLSLADAPIDLSEYRTVATAKTTTVKDLAGPPKLPAHLGVFVEPEPDGMRIAAIEPGSAAESAGLAIGDRIVALEGKPTLTLDVFRQLITGLTDGDQIALTVQRQGQAIAIPVRLGATSRPMSTAPTASAKSSAE
jgi:S1-C subfamily serine protease